MIDQGRTKPKSEAEFLKWAQNKKCLSKEDSGAWWEELEANRNIERDNKGYQGCFQVWVPVDGIRINQRERYQDNRAEETSHEIKGVSENTDDARSPHQKARDIIGGRLLYQWFY